MTFTWDFNTATLLAIVVQCVLVVVFMVRTANTAKSAMQKAEDANNNANDAHTKIAALFGEFALHREHIAREYVDRGDLRELKTTIDRLSDRIDEALNRGFGHGK